MYVCVCMYVCMHECMCVCVCVCVCMYTIYNVLTTNQELELESLDVFERQLKTVLTISSTNFIYIIA